MENIRIGDITGYDDAEIIDMGDDVYLVIDDTEEVQNNENEQQSV